MAQANDTDSVRDDIAEKAYNNALDKSAGQCAKYVRQAVEAATGKVVSRTNSAKDYGPKYEAIGFSKITSYGSNDNVNESDLKKADLLIFDEHGNHKHGHIQVFCDRNGKGKYCSDRF